MSILSSALSFASHMTPQVIQGVSALNRGRAAGAKTREDAQREREERTERRRAAQVQEAAANLNEERARLGMEVERAKLERERNAPPNPFEYRGHQFASSAEFLAHLARETETEERARARFRPRGEPRRDGGQAAGTRPVDITDGVSPAEQRALSAADRLADRYLSAAGGDVNGALRLIHQDPSARVARERGVLSAATLRAARDRYARAASASSRGGRGRGGEALTGTDLDLAAQLVDDLVESFEGDANAAWARAIDGQMNPAGRRLYQAGALTRETVEAAARRWAQAKDGRSFRPIRRRATHTQPATSSPLSGEVVPPALRALSASLGITDGDDVYRQPNEIQSWEQQAASLRAIEPGLPTAAIELILGPRP